MTDGREHTPDTMAAETGSSHANPDPFGDGKASNPGWNEAHFVNREAFARMAPPILQLEVRRTQRILQRLEPGSEMYNHLVAVRHLIRTCRKAIMDDGADVQIKPVMDHLEVAAARAALVSDGDPVNISEPGEDTIRYVADRLLYIHGQIRHLY